MRSGAKEWKSCRSRKMLQNLVNHLNLEMVQPTARAHSPSPQPTAHSPSAGFYQVFARVKVQNGIFTFFEPSLERKCRKFMFFSRVKVQNGFFTFFEPSLERKCRKSMVLIEFTVPLGLERSFWISTRSSGASKQFLYLFWTYAAFFPENSRK